MIDTLTSSPFLTSGQYSDQQAAIAAGEDDLGRDAFLTLLTTQLTNQNPLEPMDNEAFVAQLAQFSSVEGIKGMQGSLEDMVSGMRQDQMMSGANLVGKKVAVEGGLFTGGNGTPSQGSINLPLGADSIVVSVYDAQSGDLIFQETQGSKIPGQTELGWSGLNTDGSPAPAGTYIMTADVAKDGRSETAAVTTLAMVNSVKWNPQTQQLSLDIGNGTYIPLSAIESIGG
jgi:flagellar basal-body rod modification protein FlgD|tara:strand:- start:11877 stop:12563 length:687 start_codon:yes stop_codon:yes gene_type:complete